MPRFSLRTLMVVMLLGGPLCAWGWQQRNRWQSQRKVKGYIQDARERARANPRFISPWLEPEDQL
jgi:hypothetical protein